MPDYIRNAKNIIDISAFEKGKAEEIFEDVKRTGATVVLRNNKAECVLISPKDYAGLLEEIEDAYLLALANERMSGYDKSKLISQEELLKEFGICEKDIHSASDVAFE